jgi:hypothetical protein
MSKVGREDGVDTQAAVMASICYEYIDFGNEALSNNVMKCVFLQHENALYVCKPILDTLILCFICSNNANMGLIRSKLEALGASVSEGLENIRDFIDTDEP